MWGNNDWLCVFDLKNVQEDYANTLRSIIELEEIISGSHSNDAEFNKNQMFRIMRTPRSRSGVVDQIKTVEATLSANQANNVRIINSWQQIVDGLRKSKRNHGFGYYLRIDIGSPDTDITDLRFLLLLEQMVSETKDRISYFFWNSSKKDLGADTYFKISHFFHLVLSNDQRFFSLYNGSVTALTAKVSGIQRTFLPLMEIDERTLSALTTPFRITYRYNKEGFSNLYKTLVPQLDSLDGYIEFIFRIGTRFLFSAINGKHYATEQKKRTLLDFLSKSLNDSGGVTPLEIILFGALFGEDVCTDFAGNALNEYIAKIHRFSGAITQILENIVHHSQHHKGVFTVRLQMPQKYIERNYPKYNFPNEETGIEVLIADGNNLDSIVTHFLNSRKATYELQKNSNMVTLDNFFLDNPTGRAAQYWKEARAEHPEICHGLLAFATAVREFNGAFYVRSSPLYFGADDRNFVYCLPGASSSSSTSTTSSWMPGTQFATIFKRGYFINSMSMTQFKHKVFDFKHIIYSTTYADLAKALMIKKPATPLFADEETIQGISDRFIHDNSELTGQEQKDSLVQFWKSWFDNRCPVHLRETSVIYADMSEGKNGSKFYSDVEICEAFCKGFLSCTAFKKRQKTKERYIFIFYDVSNRLAEMIYQSLRIMGSNISTNFASAYFFALNSQSGSPYLASSIHDMLSELNPSGFLGDDKIGRMIPFDLLVKSTDGDTIFEREMLKQAEASITSAENPGYKINDTHMRLGNKVHIDSFFEMALFFENPNYAYHTAYLLLKRIIDNPTLQTAKRILLYGYTSYSRSIVWAAIQIWKEYLRLSGAEIGVEIEFAIYQNDLKIESDSSSVQMYFSRREWQENPCSIWEASSTTLIQIVPISSSLTTFNKMLAELNRSTKREINNAAQFTPFVNFTAFWVRDDYTESCRHGSASCPTDEERSFWKSCDPKSKIVESELVSGKIHYLVCARSHWYDPLRCEKCFPEDLLMEYPLVETDPTSTIPTQQFYLAPNDIHRDRYKDAEELENEQRIARLKGNIFFGHISRGHNHFQFYIRTRQYFQQEREHVVDWLKKLTANRHVEKDGQRHIDVLVIPKQTSNVEFSQFVYEYFFHGAAESIIVNTEKEFRSNFMAEYGELMKRLAFERSEYNASIHFHYVDTTINSGVTFNRAAALIRALNKQYSTTQKEVNLFDSVFLLFSRMSEESKKAYVTDPETNFHAYAQLHISNIRTYGDSCVPCKLQQDARLHFQSAATKSISAYWEEKSIHRECISFDQIDLDFQKSEASFRGYRRLICSHRAASYFNPVRGKSVGEYFDAIIRYFSELFAAAGIELGKGTSTDVSPVYNDLKNNPNDFLDWLSAGFKVLARPFFSFDYKLKCATMDFYLLLAEGFLNPLVKDKLAESNKKYTELGKQHFNPTSLEWVFSFVDTLEKQFDGDTERGKIERLCFIRSNILKGLTDLRSNYLIRKDTLLLIAHNVSDVFPDSEKDQKDQKAFFDHCLRSILRMMHSSSDETKSVWLEYLLTHHVEYPGQPNTRHLYEEVPKNVRTAFKYFLDLLLVENNRPLLQGVNDLKQSDPAMYSAALDQYHMRNVCKFICLDKNKITNREIELTKKELSPLISLLGLLDKAVRGDNSDPFKLYNDLRESLQQIIQLDVSESDSSNQVILFGKLERVRQMEGRAIHYYLISPNPAVNYSGESEYDSLLLMLEPLLEEHSDALDRDGYFIADCEGTDANKRIVLKFDNNYQKIMDMDIKSAKRYPIQKIEPMYIYLPFCGNRTAALKLVRKILMFRQKLIIWLEHDFNNNTIASLSRQRYWAETLSADKIGDHAEHGFIEATQKVLMEHFDNWTEEKCLMLNEIGEEEFLLENDEIGLLNWGYIDVEIADRRDWYLLCSYVNSRISRLYRTYARDENSFAGMTNPAQIEDLYSRNNHANGMEPASSLRNVFFAQVGANQSRKEYISKMLKVISFYDGDSPITISSDNQEQMLECLALQWDKYKILQFEKDGKHYAYLSEYIAVILLDCCISALRACTIWNRTRWGSKAYFDLYRAPFEEKCQVTLSREGGGRTGEIKYDYLVIKNPIAPNYEQHKSRGPGMSQQAIKWYINKLWKFILNNDDPKPEVIIEKDANKYSIKLPILKPAEE